MEAAVYAARAEGYGSADFDRVVRIGRWTQSLGVACGVVEGRPATFIGRGSRVPVLLSTDNAVRAGVLRVVGQDSQTDRFHAEHCRPRGHYTEAAERMDRWEGR